MNKLLTIALLLVAGCVPTITHQQLDGLRQQTGGGRNVSGVWVDRTTLWYTGTSSGYDYYELHRPTGSLMATTADRYRVATQNTGDEFPRTSNRTKWRNAGGDPAVQWGHELKGDQYFLTTQSGLRIPLEPATRPFDPNDLRL